MSKHQDDSLEMTEEERIGVDMIIMLQGFAGIEEEDAKALAGWRVMSDEEKKATKDIYELLFLDKEE